MKYTNPQSLTAQAMQEAKAANQRADPAGGQARHRADHRAEAE